MGMESSTRLRRVEEENAAALSGALLSVEFGGLDEIASTVAGER